MGIIKDNMYASNQSFLYYLHEEMYFHYDEFTKLCDAIVEAKENRDLEKDLDYMVNFVYGHTLKCIIYHFDKKDLYKISNLTSEYNEEIIEKFDIAVKKYFLS